MPNFDWDPIKNELLRTTRGVCFQDVQVAIQESGYLAVVSHPNQKKYGNQKLLLVKVRAYVYAVPFLEQEDGILFLKTLYPSRKFTKKYLSAN